MTVCAFGITDKGMVRTGNEDSMLVDQKLGLFVVADGMGGHRGGEVASRMAVEILHDAIARSAAGEGGIVGAIDNQYSREANLLGSGIRLANRAIFEAASANPAWVGMGTTVVAALVGEQGAGIAHVGDSRIYLLRNGQMRPLTDDHSLVAEQLRQGVITPEQARNSTQKNVITRALGQAGEVKVDLADVALQDGDRLLLCSDGLTGMVTDPEIAALIQARNDPQPACRDLVETANAHGGKDNVTAVVVMYEQASGLVAGFRRLLRR